MQHSRSSVCEMVDLLGEAEAERDRLTALCAALRTSMRAIAGGNGEVRGECYSAQIRAGGVVVSELEAVEA